MVFSVAIISAQSFQAEYDGIINIVKNEIGSITTAEGINLPDHQDTAFTSSYFNFEFKCPQGRRISFFDSTEVGFILVTQKDRFPDIVIYGKRLFNNTEANYENYKSVFNFIKNTKLQNTTSNPEIATIEENYLYDISSAMSDLWYSIDTNGMTAKAGLITTESYKSYQHACIMYSPIEIGTPVKFLENLQEFIDVRFNYNFLDYTSDHAPIAIAKHSADANRINLLKLGGVIELSSNIQRQIKMEMFDLLGKKIATVFNGPLKGSKTVRLPETGISIELYLLRMKYGKDSQNQKNLLLKK